MPTESFCYVQIQQIFTDFGGNVLQGAAQVDGDFGAAGQTQQEQAYSGHCANRYTHCNTLGQLLNLRFREEIAPDKRFFWCRMTVLML